MRLCIDAGPTENVHRTRGIGWATWHLLRAMTTERTRAFGTGSSYLRRTPFAPAEQIATGLKWARRSWSAELSGIDRRIPHGLAELWQIPESTFVLPRDVADTRADVFLATDPGAIALSPRFRTVAMVYDVIPLVMPELYLGRPGSRRDRLYRRQLARLKLADHLIAISGATRDDLIELAGVTPEHITVAPLAADRSVFHPRDPASARAELAARYGISRPFVLFVGECDPRKNVLRIVAAMSRVMEQHDVMLVMVGVVRGGTIQIKQTMEATLGPERLRWLEGVPLRDMPLLYSACSLFVFPSLYEGFGLPVLEALSCGAPVISSNRSSLPEIAGDAAVYVDPESVDELRSAIQSVLESESAQSLLRAKGPERARAFSWDRTAGRVVDACAALATPKRTG